MTAYMEGVEDQGQGTILSLLAYHSWRCSHHVTLHRPQSELQRWSPEQKAKWSIVLQLTPEGSYILMHSRLPDAAPIAQSPPLAQPQEDDTGSTPREAAIGTLPTATTEQVPHPLTKRHLANDYHATNDKRGCRTLPLQWASPEGTLGWGKILPGAMALRYLWLRDAVTHVLAPDTHLLLTLEGEAVIESHHTAQREDCVTGNADTAVLLHTQEHTGPTKVVPGLQPWHVIIVHPPTGTTTEEAHQGWTDSWSHICTTLHEGLQLTTVVFHSGTAPLTGVWTYTPTLNREGVEALKTTTSSHQGLMPTPNNHTQEGYTLWWQHPVPEGGLQPPADQPGFGPDLTAIARAVATVAQQVRAPPQGAPSVIKQAVTRHNPAFAHFRGRPPTLTGPRPPYPGCMGRPHLCAPRHRTQIRGLDGACPQTTPQHHAALQHTNTAGHRHPQHGQRPLLPPRHA